MEFRYKGFKVETYSRKHMKHLSIDRNNLEHTTGYYCYVYADIGITPNPVLTFTELSVGFEVKDESEDALRDAVIKYINDNYYTLKWTAEIKSHARLNQILHRAMNELDEYKSGKELYQVFKDRLQMTDKEIFEQGFSELVPYFNRDSYARYIAKELTDYAALRTETGCWFFKFSEVSRLFGVQLPFDKEILQKIKDSLDSNVVMDADITEGIYLNLNTAYCPRVFDEDEEDNNDET